MAAREFEHIRVGASLLFPFDDAATTLNNTNIIIEPTPGSTLIRTRLFLQFRILNYALTGDTTVEDQWQQDLQPYYGLYVNDTDIEPGVGADPIGDASDFPWVIWGVGVGALDSYQANPDFTGFFDTTYRWDMPGGISQSFAKRKTTVGNHPLVYLNWNWTDRHEVINREHGSFTVAYDLSINYGVDTLWELPPT